MSRRWLHPNISFRNNRNLQRLESLSRLQPTRGKRSKRAQDYGKQEHRHYAYRYNRNHVWRRLALLIFILLFILLLVHSVRQGLWQIPFVKYA
jgi:hypothetical protein